MDETAWSAVALAVMALPQHGRLLVPRDRVPHPAAAGLYRSRGLARRCRHYRHRLPDGRGLHVHEFADRYVVHWDAVDPSVSLVRHFLRDVLLALRRTLRRAPALAHASLLTVAGAPAALLQAIDAAAHRQEGVGRPDAAAPANA